MVGELAGTVVTVREGPPGTFTVIDTSPATRPADAAAENLAAHLELSPDGGGLYLFGPRPGLPDGFHFRRTGAPPGRRSSRWLLAAALHCAKWTLLRHS
jgi:hypothetical protein